MKKGLLVALIVLVLLSVGVLFALKQLDIPWGEGIYILPPIWILYNKFPPIFLLGMCKNLFSKDI